MSQDIINYIFGGAVSINTAILIWLFKDYLTFRFNLEKELEKSFMKRTECKITHNNTDRILQELKEDIKEIKYFITGKENG